MYRLFISLALLLLVSCQEDVSINNSGDINSEMPLNLIVSTEDLSSRGTMVNNTEEITSIALYCANTGTKKWSNSMTFNRFNNKRYYLSTKGVWRNSGIPELWNYTTTNDNYSFCAYSPHNDDNGSLTPSISDGRLSITYRVPENSADQPDLMYATPLYNITPKPDGGVPLSFEHALSCVSFAVVSRDNIRITQVEISKVANEGILNWNKSSKSLVWRVKKNAIGNFSVKIDSHYTLDNQTPTQLNSEDGYLMMIPQSFEEDVVVTLTLDNDEIRKLRIPAGSQWKAGEHYQYVVSVSNSDFIYDSTQQSNCYIIHPMPNEETVVQIPIEARINDFWENYTDVGAKITNETPTSDFSVKLVWEDIEGDINPQSYLVYDKDGMMAAHLVFPKECQEGNYIFSIEERIAEAFKNTIWSWHLWFTDYDPDALAKMCRETTTINNNEELAFSADGYEGEVHRYRDADGVSECDAVWRGMYANKFIMDRNIGERNTRTTAAIESAGAVYYQFGRKDPIPGKVRMFEDGKTELGCMHRDEGTFEEGVHYPIYYLTAIASPYNWSWEEVAMNYSHVWFDQRLPLDNYTGGKSIFDPSPLGWMVPVAATWSSYVGVSTSDCQTADFVAEYDAYGYRNTKQNGSLTKNPESYVWSSTPTAQDKAVCFHYPSTEVYNYTNMNIANGLPVRAIEE